MGCKYCKTKYDKEKIEKSVIKDIPRFKPELKYAYVIKVYDGDTITIIAPVLNVKNNRIFKFSVRIFGIDCPELRTKDTMEKKYALKAKEFACCILLHKHIKLKDVSYDKYGRLLASIYVNGENYSCLILREGLAYEYFGKTKEPPKCWEEYYNNKQKYK